MTIDDVPRGHEVDLCAECGRLPELLDSTIPEPVELDAEERGHAAWADRSALVAELYGKEK